jgi:uncharacterized protein (DUF924 family)
MTEVMNEVTGCKAVLDYWFADALTEPQAIARRQGVWFKGGASFDRECTERFAATLAAAISGEIDLWKQRPRGRLALILLLDQFSRNVFRGTARAFQQDEYALALCREGIAQGDDRQLLPMERTFFYMPLEHAEDRAIQALSVQCFEALAEEGPQELREQLRANAGYARQHRDIVEIFGRFPHRNAVLGRQSTAEEETYLAGEVPRFGQ